MAPYDDAVKAATEALQVCTCEPMREGDLWREVDIDCPACGDSNARSRAAVAAAAPILLAAERARIAELEAVLADVVDGLLRDGRSPAMRCLLALNALIKHGVLTEHGGRIAETAPEEGQ